MKIVKIISKIVIVPMILVSFLFIGLFMAFMQGGGASIDSSEEIIEIEGDFVGPYIDGNFVITSDVGERPLQNSVHQGIDVSKGYGESVIALTDSEVYSAKNTCPPNNGYLGNYCPFTELSGGGNYVVLRFEHGGKTYYVSYLHLSEIKVQKGQTVKKGQVIGKEGNSGNSTGSHLHVEIHHSGLYVGSSINWVNPRVFLKFE